MSKRVISCVNAITVCLIATAALLGSNHATLADDCLAGPNRPPAPGGHWYYRLDRAADRKCWYLVEPPARAPTTEAPAPPPVSRGGPPQPPFGSFFSSLGFAGSTPQPDTTGDARIMQSTRPDDPRSDDAARPATARRPPPGHGGVTRPEAASAGARPAAGGACRRAGRVPRTGRARRAVPGIPEMAGTPEAGPGRTAALLKRRAAPGPGKAYPLGRDLPCLKASWWARSRGRAAAASAPIDPIFTSCRARRAFRRRKYSVAFAACLRTSA